MISQKSSNLLRSSIWILPLLAVAPLCAQSIEVAADTYVFADTPEVSYGAAETFQTANEGGTLGLLKPEWDKWSIFRFDLPPESGATTFAEAQIVLEQVANARPDLLLEFDLYGITDLGADELFNELTYTYDSSAYKHPGTNNGYETDGGLLKTDLILLGEFSTSGPGQVSFSSSALDDFLNADSNQTVTFILYQSTAQKFARDFASKESGSGQAPTLIIPEPNAYALIIGIFGVALAGIRRRRR